MCAVDYGKAWVELGQSLPKPPKPGGAVKTQVLKYSILLNPSEKCGKTMPNMAKTVAGIFILFGKSGHRRILFSLKVNRIEQMRTNLLNHSKREENKCTYNAVAAATVHRTVSNQTKPSESQIEPYKTESII